MKALEKGAPVAAVVAALSTLACCVPLGFLGAVGLAGVSVWAQPHRTFLLGASVALLCLGFAQLYFRRSSTCVRRSAASLVLFWTAVALVLLVILFPQVIASLLVG